MIFFLLLFFFLVNREQDDIFRVRDVDSGIRDFGRVLGLEGGVAGSVETTFLSD